MARILVACEQSQAVTKAFRKLGHEAYSCDLLPCSGGHPEWHIHDTIFTPLMDNDGWDLIIAHPPCTRLTVTGNKWYKIEYRDRFPNILQEREDAIKLFMVFVDYMRCKHIAIENPIGIMSTIYRKPDQIIQPWQFGQGSVANKVLALLPFVLSDKFSIIL